MEARREGDCIELARIVFSIMYGWVSCEGLWGFEIGVISGPSLSGRGLWGCPVVCRASKGGRGEVGAL